MVKELTPKEIIFCEPKSNIEVKKSNDHDVKAIPEIADTLNEIKNALNIEKSGYNIYYVDSFSKDKVENLIEYVETIYNKLDPPKDICYVILEDKFLPKTLFVENGKGILLKELIDDIKEKYFECVINFYSGSSNDEKEDILDEINKKRNEYIADLMEMAKAKNFDVKATSGGFVFIPLKDTGEEMTQSEYEKLENNIQYNIEKDALKLKREAEAVLDKLKNLEMTSIEKIKDLYKEYIKTFMQEEKDDLLLTFISQDSVYRYLIEMLACLEDEIVECYTINLEDDEEILNEIFDKYQVNVLVDNSDIKHPKVYYEEDPTLSNLLGNIEYRNNNGIYSTDISLINAGSLLEVNEGCLIIRLSSLISSGASYYYLKKALIHRKLDYNYTRNYLEVLSIAGLKPDCIPINVKVILIGDYESFDILYNRDEDFKRVFPIVIESDIQLNYNDRIKNSIISMIEDKINKENLLTLTNESMEEVIKFLSRVAGERNKISIDDYYLDRLLHLSNNNAKLYGRKNIERSDIIDVAYKEEKIQEEVMESYKNRKILITTNGAKIGIINALSVVGNGFCRFGKPMRITCIALPGDGRIVDVHKESKLSGNIHEKSIAILRGLVGSLISPYEKLPVDLQLSFEQTYGMVEGDSASVAEIICILSALSKRPVRQNIAVTGSINQFGEIQPIGGVNEKIEGFHKVCTMIDNIEDKGVLIPYSNKDELILKNQIEDDVKKNKFHIYIMETLEDAIEVLILEKNESIKGFFKEIEDELLKYKNVRKKK